MSVQPFLIGDGWLEVLDGNDTARSIFSRHYSFSADRRDGRRVSKLIGGPGHKLLLVTADAGALCVWRKEKYRFDDQAGVNCAIYRRERGPVASELLSASMKMAWSRWPGERLFTFVDPREVSPTIPSRPADMEPLLLSRLDGGTQGSQRRGFTFWNAPLSLTTSRRTASHEHDGRRTARGAGESIFDHTKSCQRN